MTTVTELALEQAPILDRTTAGTVRSAWRMLPLYYNGYLHPDEWRDAPVLPFGKGAVLVKNDESTVWLGVDVDMSGVPDSMAEYYLRLFVDVDGDGKPTPYRDLLFSTRAGRPYEMGRWLLTGAEACAPSSTPLSTAAMIKPSVGPSHLTAADHRFWEVVLPLAEIDPAFLAHPVPRVLRLGLQIGCLPSGFNVEVPPYASHDFSEFLSVILARRPEPRYEHGPGAVIAGIGSVAATQIDHTTGLTTVQRNDIHLFNAAFGGVLDFRANVETLAELRKNGAKAFAIRHRVGKTLAEINAAPWANFITAWSNPHWSGSRFVNETFGPSAKRLYRLLDAPAHYAEPALLFRWNTEKAAEALHQFELDFFDGNGTKLDAPAQRVLLRVHNRPPTVELQLLAHGVAIKPEEVVTIASQWDAIHAVVSVADSEGLLEGYQLVAQHGNGQSIDVMQNFYTWEKGATPRELWFGEKKTVIWVVPATAMYRMRLNAISRVTDGWQRQLLYSETSMLVGIHQPYTDVTEHGRIAQRHIEPPPKFLVPVGFTREGRVEL